MTVCVYLPDGRVGFMFQRPEIASNDAFDAGGLRFDVDEPFEQLRVTYEGKLVILDDPLAMADPRKAFTENPYLPCTASHHLHAGQRHVRRRAGGVARDARARSSPAATTSSSSGPRARSPSATDTWDRRRRRPARPLVGTAHVAGAALLPLAHRELRRRLRASCCRGSPGRDGRRHARRLRVGRRASCTCATDAEISTELGGRRPLPPADPVQPRPRARHEWKGTGTGHQPHPAAQPPRGTGHPHLRGHDRVDARATGASATACRSTSTRSSTGSRSASPSNPRPVAPRTPHTGRMRRRTKIIATIGPASESEARSRTWSRRAWTSPASASPTARSTTRIERFRPLRRVEAVARPADRHPRRPARAQGPRRHVPRGRAAPRSRASGSASPPAPARAPPRSSSRPRAVCSATCTPATACRSATARWSPRSSTADARPPRRHASSTAACCRAGPACTSRPTGCASPPRRPTTSACSTRSSRRASTWWRCRSCARRTTSAASAPSPTRAARWSSPRSRPGRRSRTSTASSRRRARSWSPAATSAPSCPIEELPHLQKRIIQRCIALGRPAITATQMLESMVHAPSPDPGRGLRRRQRGVRRLERGDALGRDRHRPRPGQRGRHHGPHRRPGRRGVRLRRLGRPGCTASRASMRQSTSTTSSPTP